MIAHLLLFVSLAIVPTGAWRIPRAEDVNSDKSISSYTVRQKQRMDLFDFSGEYTNLQDIDIDGKRLKEAELLLTGSYPLLKTVCFDGGLGSICAKLTGSFPLLEEINFACNAAKLDLDLTGKWEKDCAITLTSLCGEMAIALPKDVGVIIYSKNGFGKFKKGSLKKKGWFKNKHYFNELYSKTPITLHISIESKEGRVILT